MAALDKRSGILGKVVVTDDGRFIESPADGSLSKIDDGDDSAGRRPAARDPKRSAPPGNQLTKGLFVDDDEESPDALLEALDVPPEDPPPVPHESPSADTIMAEIDQLAGPHLEPTRTIRSSAQRPRSAPRPPRTRRPFKRNAAAKQTSTAQTASPVARRSVRGSRALSGVRGRRAAIVGAGLVLLVAVVAIVLAQPVSSPKRATKTTSTLGISDSVTVGAIIDLTGTLTTATETPKPVRRVTHHAAAKPVHHTTPVSPVITPAPAVVSPTPTSSSVASSAASSSDSTYQTSHYVPPAPTHATTTKSSSSTSSKGASASDFGGATGCSPTC